MDRNRIRRFGAATAAAVFVVGGSALLADHSWGTYHRARTTASFNLTVINSTTPDWDSFVGVAIADWSQSRKLNMIEDVSGSTTSRDRRQCRAPDGGVRICNLAYGFNGWLGIAGISLDRQGHIVRGYTKLNDSYFSTSYYNTPDWKQSVTCQELGHNIGLDHQDEDFDNDSLFSCMDYQDPPFPKPNAHDYEQLETIYGHTDSYNSYATSLTSGTATCNPGGRNCDGNAGAPQNDAPEGWGISLGRRGNKEKFLRIDPDGTRHLTFVTWVEGR